MFVVAFLRNMQDKSNSRVDLLLRFLVFSCPRNFMVGPGSKIWPFVIVWVAFLDVPKIQLFPRGFALHGGLVKRPDSKGASRRPRLPGGRVQRNASCDAI